jgi:hypothetical protein
LLKVFLFLHTFGSWLFFGGSLKKDGARPFPDSHHLYHHSPMSSLTDKSFSDPQSLSGVFHD